MGDNFVMLYFFRFSRKIGCRTTIFHVKIISHEFAKRLSAIFFQVKFNVKYTSRAADFLESPCTNCTKADQKVKFLPRNLVSFPLLGFV